MTQTNLTKGNVSTTIKEHIYVDGCETGDCGGTCYSCTLSICKICGCLEGSLATECPGVESYAEFGNKIYAGEVDYRNGQWIDNMRNRGMYGSEEEVIKYESLYLKMLRGQNFLDLSRISEAKKLLNDAKEEQKKYMQKDGY